MIVFEQWHDKTKYDWFFFSWCRRFRLTWSFMTKIPGPWEITKKVSLFRMVVLLSQGKRSYYKRSQSSIQLEKNKKANVLSCCCSCVDLLIHLYIFSSFQWQVICAFPTVKMNSVLLLFVCLFYLNGPRTEPDESIPSASPKMHARSTNAF